MLSAAGGPREALVVLDAADRHSPRNARQAMQRLDISFDSGDTVGARIVLDRASDIPNFLEPAKEVARRRLSFAIDAPHSPLADRVAREEIAETESNPGYSSRDFLFLTRLGHTDDALSLAIRHFVRPEVFFRPKSRPVLMNPQFPEVARRSGLWDYWQRTGHWPDICKDPALPWRCGNAVNRR